MLVPPMGNSLVNGGTGLGKSPDRSKNMSVYAQGAPLGSMSANTSTTQGGAYTAMTSSKSPYLVGQNVAGNGNSAN